MHLYFDVSSKLNHENESDFPEQRERVRQFKMILFYLFSAEFEHIDESERDDSSGERVSLTLHTEMLLVI